MVHLSVHFALHFVVNWICANLKANPLLTKLDDNVKIVLVLNTFYYRRFSSCIMILVKWTGGDLNPRPLECKSSVHTS
jgi:hypothetical protein